MKLYTAIFNHMEGTHVTQVRVESVDLVLEAWLTALKTETTTVLGRVRPISVLGFFDSLTESKRSFEQQIRETLARGEGLAALTEVSVWCASFLITLLDVEHNDRCPALTAPGRSHPDCPACFEGASHMCELYVVETASSVA